VLVNDVLQIGFSPALPSSSISASPFDPNNYTGFRLGDLRLNRMKSARQNEHAERETEF
jgi:hypothetical protein